MATTTNVKTDSSGTFRQQIINQLKTIRNKYTTEHKALDTKLDNNHHAYMMKEFGEDKQLHETIEELKNLIVAYDTTTFTLTFDINGCTMSGSNPPPPQWAMIPESTFTLPSKGYMVAPTGKLLYGWCTTKDGTGERYKFGASFTMPLKNITLYALLGPDPDYVPPEEEES